MKRNKVLFVTLLASVFGLASCDLGFIQIGDKKEEVNEQTQSSSSSSQSSSNSSSDSSSSGSPSSGSSTSTSYTLTQIVKLVNDTFKADLGEDLLEYDSSKGYYAGELDFSVDGEDYSNTKPAESVLTPVVDYMKEVLPSELGKSGYHFWTTAEDYWEDNSGDTVAELYYEEIPGGLAEVDILVYCYEESLLCDVYVEAPSNN